MRLSATPAALFACTFAVVGSCRAWNTCDPNDIDAATLAYDDVQDSVCTTARFWAEGSVADEHMRPGAACLSCHQREGGPNLTIAGTLYTRRDEAVLCQGIDGTADTGRSMHLEIHDGSGAVIVVPVNKAGNFFTNAPVHFPIGDVGVFEGTTRLNPASVGGVRVHEIVADGGAPCGDCNGCHSPRVVPGRIRPSP